MPIEITRNKISKAKITVQTSRDETAVIRGKNLFDLVPGNFQKSLYEGLVLEFEQLSGPEAGSVRVKIAFGILYTTVFTLGWKTKAAEVGIGGECYRIELT